MPATFGDDMRRHSTAKQHGFMRAAKPMEVGPFAKDWIRDNAQEVFAFAKFFAVHPFPAGLLERGIQPMIEADKKEVESCADDVREQQEDFSWELEKLTSCTEHYRAMTLSTQIDLGAADLVEQWKAHERHMNVRARKLQDGLVRSLLHYQSDAERRMKINNLDDIARCESAWVGKVKESKMKEHELLVRILVNGNRRFGCD